MSRPIAVVAVLGLGRMGQAVAERLLDQGVGVVVWNRSPGNAAHLVEGGASEAASVEAAIAPAEAVVTCLSNDEAVRSVVLATGGVVDVLGARLLLEASTVSPPLSEEVSAAVPESAGFPIMGSPDAVRSGRATYLLGCDDAVAGRARPIVDLLSGKCLRFESAAQASAAKLASNLLLIHSVVGLAESVAVARDGGLSDEQIRALLGDTPILGPSVKNRFEAVLTGSGASWWTVELAIKDVGLALDVTTDSDGRLPTALVVRRRLEAAAARGLGQEDLAAVAELSRRDGGCRPG